MGEEEDLKAKVEAAKAVIEKRTARGDTFEDLQKRLEDGVRELREGDNA